ncbi:ubiquitin carboxyl-terminal hydrolase family protein, partial [Trifolium medium]|nr:ubiquitin carboxyl-terminal hydrolase family protein [Trifolium medium]
MEGSAIAKDTQHRFNERESDWGFTSFIPLRELFDPSRGFIVTNALVVEVDVTFSVDDEDTADSAAEHLK